MEQDVPTLADLPRLLNDLRAVTASVKGANTTLNDLVRQRTQLAAQVRELLRQLREEVEEEL